MEKPTGFRGRTPAERALLRRGRAAKGANLFRRIKKECRIWHSFFGDMNLNHNRRSVRKCGKAFSAVGSHERKHYT